MTSFLRVVFGNVNTNRKLYHVINSMLRHLLYEGDNRRYMHVILVGPLPQSLLGDITSSFLIRLLFSEPSRYPKQWTPSRPEVQLLNRLLAVM